MNRGKRIILRKIGEEKRERENKVETERLEVKSG